MPTATLVLNRKSTVQYYFIDTAFLTFFAKPLEDLCLVSISYNTRLRQKMMESHSLDQMYLIVSLF